jgi:hypothetical protein
MLRTLLALLMIVGCSSSSTVGGMRARAAKDWSCPESSIDVTNQGQDVFRVSGCGQTVLYECSGDAPSGPGGGPPPQSNVNAEQEYRFQGAGTSCSKVTRD